MLEFEGTITDISEFMNINVANMCKRTGWQPNQNIFMPPTFNSIGICIVVLDTCVGKI